jgi:hypothetical protein
VSGARRAKLFDSLADCHRVYRGLEAAWPGQPKRGPPKRSITSWLTSKFARNAPTSLGEVEMPLTVVAG